MWYRIQLDREMALTCPVCKAPYRAEFCPAYEVIPSSRTVSSFFLYNPYILSLFVYYGQVVKVAFIQSDRFYSDPYEHLRLQAIIHAIYFSIFFNSISVKNWGLYARQTGVYYQLLITVKLLLWLYVMNRDALAMSVNTLGLTIYWRIHLSGLESVNAALTRP
jgi:hypothetical protein